VQYQIVGEKDLKDSKQLEQQEIANQLLKTKLAKAVNYLTNQQIIDKLIELGVTDTNDKQQLSEKGIGLQTAGFTFQGEIFINSDINSEIKSFINKTKKFWENFK
jgi:predicted transcriptional regulator